MKISSESDSKRSLRLLVSDGDNGQVGGKKLKTATKQTKEKKLNTRLVSVTAMNGEVKVRKREAEKLRPGLKSSRLRRARKAAQRSHSKLGVPLCGAKTTK